jgi:carboxypeptidase Taq
MSAYQNLLARLGEISQFANAAAVLGWDQQCYMPSGGALPRANQLAALSKLCHELFVSDETRQLLEAAEAERHSSDSDEGLCLRAVRRDFDKSAKLPTALVETLSRETALGHEVWVKARAENDFGHFAPTLQKLLDLSKQVAECYGYTEHIYDALLDQYEPGMKTSEVKRIFAELRDGLIAILKITQSQPQVSDACLRRDFNEATQLVFSESVARHLGFDFTRGRQDKAVHPFCTSFTRYDVRITTRTDKNWLPCALMGTIHETGHGLYEQGFAEKDDDTPLASATSLGFHESQSRLWENIIGRSKPFWTIFYPELKAGFPGVLDDIALSDFYRAINKVEPSLIRVEADEVTYCLHIMIRFEIEQALIDGSLTVDALPAAWNAKYEQYLGITPPNDAEGCLQDVHWSGAMFGYFPTYALGTMLASQLFEAAVAAKPEIQSELAVGEFGTLLGWLRTNIHEPGRRYLPTELVERVCKKPMSATPYLNYLEKKYRDVYEVRQRIES